MREMVKRIATEHLYKLMDITLESESVTDDQADLLYSIIDELMERGEMQKISEEEVRASYQHLLEKVEKQKGQSNQALVNVTKENPKPSKSQRKWLHPALVAASIAVALFLTNAVTLAVGFDFFGSVARWSKDAVYFIFGSPTEDGKEMDPEYCFLNDTLVNLSIQVDLPKYLPSGFRFDTIEPDEPTEFSPIHAWFIRGESEFFINVKRVASTVSFSEANDEEQSEVYKGKYMIAMNNDRIKALWYQGIYEIIIQGTLTYEELTQILDSI